MHLVNLYVLFARYVNIGLLLLCIQLFSPAAETPTAVREQEQTRKGLFSSD